MFVIVLYIMFIIGLFLVLFLLQFYRDPKRKIPAGNNIVSPADGTIISIRKGKKEKTRIKKGVIGTVESLIADIGKECYVISIFMSPFDVHVNRAPIGGTVISVKPTKGKFFAAYDLEKSLRNEKNEIIIQNKKIGMVKVIQIAGFLARRIICSVKENQKVNKGNKIGMIVLGSQATIIIPVERIKIQVRERQHVKAGSTIIATVV